MEILIASLITATVVTAGFRFYATMHQQALAQGDISETQQLCRGSLHEIAKTLRMAGFKVPTGHSSYLLSGDTLAVYFSNVQPVDTILYYLEEFTSAEYAKVPGLPTGQLLWKLMKQTNSAPPAVFSDYISSINYVVVNARTMAITITVYADRFDDSYVPNSGFRKSTLGRTVMMRNAG